MTAALSFIHKLSRMAAIGSGLLLAGLALLIVISVTGRAINQFGIGPVPGDFELVEHGMTAVVLYAMPWCQIQFGHVSVDVLSRHFPRPVSWGISMLSQTGFIILSFFITRQLYLGMTDKWTWMETSMILQMPVWWGYAAVLPASGLWVLSCCTAAWQVACSLQQKEIVQ